MMLNNKRHMHIDIVMSEYGMMELAVKNKDNFHIDPESFTMGYANNSNTSQLFNTNGGESNPTNSEESLTALLAEHAEITTDSSKLPMRRAHPKMSWIFTKGYGERVRSETGHMVRCCVENCGRLYITNNGSTSAFKKHLEKIHNLVEHPDSIRPLDSTGRGENGVPKPRKPHAPRKGRMRDEPLMTQEGKSLLETSTLPLPISQDGQLLNLLQYGGTPVDQELLKPSGVLSDNREHFFRVHCAVKELIQAQVSISLSVDHWLNPQGEFVLAITAHFISDGWEPREVLLDIQVRSHMTGAEAAGVLVNVAESYGAWPLIATITTDNSPTMQIMVEELARAAMVRTDFKFNPSTDHIPCLSFIIESAANGALSLVEQSTTGSIMDRLKKMRLGINSISKNPQTLNFYQSFFALRKEEHLPLIADEMLRWDLTYQMAERLLAVQLAYNETCNGCGLPELALDQADLELLEEVKHLLGPLQAFAVRVSTQRYPTITQIFPLYVKVLEYLDSNAQNKSGFIQQAYRYAHQTFRSHFGKASPNINFAFSFVVDPRVKLEGWSHPVYSYDDAEGLKAFVRGYWDKNHNKNQAASCLNDFPQSTFDTIFEVDHITVADDLSRYLREPRINSKIPYESAVYDFWRSHAQVYPQLAPLARKFFAIPITSMPCGRQLLYNRQLVSSAYNDPDVIQMAREFSLLHSWRK